MPNPSRIPQHRPIVVQRLQLEAYPLVLAHVAPQILGLHSDVIHHTLETRILALLLHHPSFSPKVYSGIVAPLTAKGKEIWSRARSE
jgi:hypothetical protein